MDLQSALISLCMEVVEQKVSKVYADCSNEKKSKMFMLFSMFMEKENIKPTEW